MHVKKSLMLWVAVFALALPLLLTGTASAKYMDDGAVQDGVTGGWKTPNDMICIVGVHADGTLDIAAGVTNRRNCIYYTTGLTTMAAIDSTATYSTSASCTGTNPTTKGTLVWNAADSKCYDSANCTVAGYGTNDGAKHAWATSICEDGSGNGISLADVDRTYSMCVAKGGTWKQTSATKPYPTAPGTFPTPNYGGSCIAYGAQFKGQDASGTPLAFGAEGTTQAAGTGFCYTTIRTGIAPASCPTVIGSANGTKTETSVAAFGYSSSATACNYTFGINGAINSTLTKVDGTTYAAGTVVDLSAFTTMGDCLANGGSWANWIPMGTLATVGTGTFAITNGAVTFDLTRQAADADEGCLHCHSSVTQYNGPAERWKDSYLKTGHKNMLRKVTAGNNYAGPDGVMYDTLGYAVGSLNFGTTGNNDATATVGGVAKPLLYLFGDWMAAAPGGLDVVVDMSGAAKYNGGSDYSCAACHTVGWSNTDPAKGLCNKSQYTTSATCGSNGGVWTPLTGVQAIGTPGYAAKQPGDSFPGITFGAAGQWDLDGIQCGRCHNATVPSVTAAQIAASAFPRTYETKGGMGNVPAGPSGAWATNLCYSCHQSMAKTSNGTGLDADLAHPEALPVKNNATAPAYIPGFSGHVLGGSFLNSPHAGATADVVPNSLGKYDINNITYSSTFKGYMCWQSPSSNSPAKTKADGHEIKTKAECETLYGAGAWRPDAQGNCTTCHDVHQSLFVAGQEGLRKECVSCHDNSDYATAVAGTSQASILNHPTGPGTPVDIDPADPCVVCHMPKPTAADFPMHVWRINSDAAYSTFPTYAEFNGICSNPTYTTSANCTGGGGTWTAATRKNANIAADGSYTNAVWVDLDLACGQCHGGSKGPGATTNGAMYKDKADLSSAARNMHGLRAVGVFTATTDTQTSYVVNFDASGSSNASTYDWNFGDGFTGSGVITSHTYTNTNVRTVTLTLNNDVTVTRIVTPVVVNHAPVAGGLSSTYPSTSLAPFVVTNATNNVSFMDGSTDADSNITSIVVKWGDGTVSTAASAGAPFSHTYARAGKYTITMTVRDAGNKYSYDRAFVKIVPQTYSISGFVKNAAGTSISGATVYLKMSGRTRAIRRSAPTTGAFSFSNVTTGAYTITTLKAGYAFDILSLGTVAATVSNVTITAH
jgi:hypothetical protein